MQQGQEQLPPAMRRIADQRGMAVLLVEETVRAALNVADRGYVLSLGTIGAQRSAAELKRDAQLLESSYLRAGTPEALSL